MAEELTQHSWGTPGSRSVRLHSDSSGQAESTTRSRSSAAKRANRLSLTESERIALPVASKRRKLLTGKSLEAVRAANQLKRSTNAVIASTLKHTRDLLSVKAIILNASSNRLSSNSMEEKVCCVCDCLQQQDRLKLLPVKSNPVLVAAMSKRLRPPHNLSPRLLSYYDASSLHPDLSGILVSKAGVVGTGRRCAIRVCSSCRTCLLDKKRVHPPKFAVTNGLYMGRLPEEFCDSTFTENAMLNLAQPMHFITVVRGGKQASLRSHAYFFRADPAPPALLLPRDVVSEGIVGVMIADSMTPALQAATRKKYDVRVKRLQEQLAWYVANNPLYSRIERRED